MKRVGGVLSALALGLLAGGMLFFPIMTLLLFTRLPRPIAGPFVSSCFPVYYAYMLVFAALAGVGLALGASYKAAMAVWAICLITLWEWLWMIPQMNADLLTGNMVSFNRFHTFSTWVDGIEFIVVLGLLARQGILPGKP